MAIMSQGNYENVKINAEVLRNIVDNASNVQEISLALFFLILRKYGVIDSISGVSSIHDLEHLGDISSKEFECLKFVTDAIWPEVQKLGEDGVDKLIRLTYTLDKEIFEENFPEFFETILESCFKSIGPSTGESVIPKEISKFITYLVPLPKSALIYNPFSGLGSFGLYSRFDSDYVGQEINKTTNIIALLRQLAAGRYEKKRIVVGNSIHNWNPFGLKYHLIISSPPLGMPVSDYSGELDFATRSVEYFIIQKGLKDLKNNGKIVLLVPQSFLTSSIRGEVEVRKDLLEKNLISMIISFPTNLLTNTSVKFNVIVIDKTRKEGDKIKFVDASSFVYYNDGGDLKLRGYKLSEVLKERTLTSKVVRSVDPDTVLAQDGNLDVKRYFAQDFDGTKLSEVCKFVTLVKKGNDSKGKYVRIRDLKDSIIDYTLNVNSIKETTLPDYASKIQKSCILLASRWNSFRPTYFEFEGTPIYIPQDIFAIGFNSKKIDGPYLISQLRSKMVSEQADLFRTGSTIPFIKKSDLFNIKIEIPELIEQQRHLYQTVLDVEKSAVLREAGLEQLIQKIQKDQKDDLSIKKHNIMQHLNNVKASAESLIIQMERNAGVLNAQSIINPLRGTKVIDSFNRMIQSINDSLFFVDNITNDNSYDKLEEINIEDLLRESLDRTAWDNKLFSIRLFVDRFSLRVNSESEEEILPISEVSRKEFYELFNNVIENASRHGFVNKNKKYLINILLTANLAKGTILISFENNGKSFPSGMAQRYCIKGERAGKTANTGIGSWKVCEIARYFGGFVVAHDFRGTEFPVRIDIELPLKQNNI
jgi:type I restriction enzyme M protein